jgi:hypothetical protein
MALSTEISGDGGVGGDPFTHVDYTTAMSVLESDLHGRLGEIAKQQQEGLIGAMRVWLQRLLPKRFGTEITPEAIGRLFRYIRYTTARDARMRLSDPWQQQTRDWSVFESTRFVVREWQDKELLGYLAQVEEQTRQRGSFAYVLAGTDARAEEILGDEQAEP